jgi:ubiquinol-cytochrome c reductase cytochrome b subunit
MGAEILIMLTIPFTNSSEIRSSYFRPIYTKIFWFFAADCLILMWIGQNVVESPYVEIGQVATVIYFAYFIIVIPFFGHFERYLLRMKV